MAQANAVEWFEIIDPDGPKLRSFYGELFDWKFQEAPGVDYGMIEAAKGGIGGGIGSGQLGMSYVAVYVHVDDINASLKKAEGLGGKTVMPKTVIPGQVTFALLTDPGGHYVGLLEDQS